MIDIALLVLRLGLGVMFLAHGLQIALGKLGGPGVTNFSGMLAKMGFVPALAWAYVAGYTLLIGSIMVLAGFATRIASLFLLIFITVALVKVHLVKGFFLQGGGYEYNFVIASICIALLLAGPGKYSICSKC